MTDTTQDNPTQSTGDGLIADSPFAKAVTVSFMISGVLTWLISSLLLTLAANMIGGGFARFMAQDLAKHGIPIALGLAVFLFLQTNAGVRVWADEVAAEIGKVVWPSRADTWRLTVFVTIFVLIAGVVFGVMDVVSGSAIDWLIKQNILGFLS
jgi:preprotein translocase subunit SecE